MRKLTQDNITQVVIGRLADTPERLRGVEPEGQYRVGYDVLLNPVQAPA